ncbi:ABC transporter permease [Herbiconiux sp. KACC 21604]|uniref:ABC transporter permease n=1 Tax=unclassified Herbiconiux TaxID=2618217 RepID=UPI00149186CD|nr:ABC transporter permease [Herbiconiux sp. SALV-R1]QJU55284.1 ABC transporter permease [Herbiconiux sp. SALV-R1]WPO86451.1 ABC transporter permease [Herbiconiux sp. KACC 21604]
MTTNPSLSLRRRPDLTRLIRAGSGAQYLGLIIALVVVSVALSLLSPYFLRPANLLNIGAAISFTGIVAAITTAVLISGGLDLSISAVMAFSGCVVAVSLSAGLPWWLAIGLAMLSGLVIGAVNGGLISYVGINPFVVTVGTQFLVRGLAFLVTAGVVIPVSDPVVRFLGQGRIFGVPFSLLLMAVAFVVAGFLLRSTVWGRHWYAIGGSPEGRMARLAGIPVRRRTFQLYVLSAVFSAVAGAVVAGYTTVGDANALTGLELSILAGVILGGTALTGGRGTVIGTVFGVILIGVINNGIQLLNLGVAAQFIFLGGILLIAVVFDQIKTRRQTR